MVQTRCGYSRLPPLSDESLGARLLEEQFRRDDGLLAGRTRRTGRARHTAVSLVAVGSSTALLSEPALDTGQPLWSEVALVPIVTNRALKRDGQTSTTSVLQRQFMVY